MTLSNSVGRNAARILAHSALDKGATIPRPGKLHWDIAGSCSDSIRIGVDGRDWRDRPGPHRPPLMVDMDVRCRKCEACLRQRSALWRNRARVECQLALRTWFGTLTLRPDAHYKALCQAATRCGSDPAEWSPERVFRERVTSIGPEITKYLKRVRAQSGAQFRYCLVAEAHKSGLPHFHFLLHERQEGGQVTKRQLQGQWPHGFSALKLVKDHTRAAFYVAKYLSKSAMARVRASARYGAAGRHLSDNEVCN